MADENSWLSSRTATNQLLVVTIVVLAAGFISVDGGYGGLQVVAELFLVVVLLGAIVLFLGWLVSPDRPDAESRRDGDR
ncbi:hypothetical protein [Salinilacihabitans rarus]|uniref:hypothetical protein n=1 Tax=Salinilacihabitans rarus TaxID=2961596 RepID=UPI0020C8AB91|nr:hypothetical protein [Salinilacihabitans rarus]